MKLIDLRLPDIVAGARAGIRSQYWKPSQAWDLRGDAPC
jgi:hypothetical protein